MEILLSRLRSGWQSSATSDASGTATMELPFGTQKFVVVKDRYLPAEQWVNVEMYPK
jgi:hypothetical protein